MKRAVTLAVFFGLLLAGSGHTGYRELLQDFEGYRLPEISRVEPPPVPVGAAGPQTAADRQRLEDLRKGWEQVLGSDPVVDDFFRPAPEQWAAARRLGADPEAVRARLGRPFSIDTLAALVLVRHPGIRGAEDRVHAALAGFSQVAALDEVLGRYAAFTSALMNAVGPMKGGESVAMNFPFPGVSALRGEIVDLEVRGARENLGAARRDAVTAAREAYWELLFVEGARRITSETRNLFQNLEDVALARYEAGRTSFQDVVKVRIRLKILGDDLLTLREQRHTLASRIAELVDLKPPLRLGAPARRSPAPGVPDLDSLYAAVLENRPELRRLRFNLKRRARMLEMGETMVIPPFTLNLSLYANDAVLSAGPGAVKPAFPASTGVARGAGLPKNPWIGPQDAYLVETRRKLAALQADLEQAEAAARTAVRRRWYELERAQRQITLYRETVVRLSQSALEVSTSAYESGQLAFADVIGSYTLWLEANLKLIAARRDAGVARARLAQVVGRSL
jgi:hypothetical protein